VFEALSAVHPPEPSWYLSLIGVDPRHQGRGYGGALLRTWLDEVDAQSAAAYLETDRAELVPFYAGSGFRCVRSFDLFDVEVHCLWRPRRVPDSHRSSR
jgi:GNAT superfamily N-acetyltransferase